MRIGNRLRVLLVRPVGENRPAQKKAKSESDKGKRREFNGSGLVCECCHGVTHYTYLCPFL